MTKSFKIHEKASHVWYWRKYASFLYPWYLFNCRPPHEHIHLMEKKQVFQCTNSKMLFVKRNLHCLKINIAVCVIVLGKFLSLEISPLNEWSIDSTAAFPCKTFHWNFSLEVFIEIFSLIFPLKSRVLHFCMEHKLIYW